MTQADHDNWRDDVAAYLLGALEPEQAAKLALNEPTRILLDNVRVKRATDG